LKTNPNPTPDFEVFNQKITQLNDPNTNKIVNFVL